MDNWSFHKRPLKLHELLEELDNLENDIDVPDSIVILPPANAHGYNTDEDSGDENDITINNLPGSQLAAEAEVTVNNPNSDLSSEDLSLEEANDFDSEDDLPLSVFVTRDSTANQATRSLPKKNKKKIYSWKKIDIISNFSDWQEISGPRNNLSPLELFFLFVDDDIINLICHYSNIYASQHNSAGDISTSEIKCFIGVLLLSGYNNFPRRSMYWENTDDVGNKLVYSAISRDRFNFIMQNIHFNDNNTLDISDKFSKMRPLFSALNKKFLSLAPTVECHSLDESMVPYFGGHGSKQFIRGKPIRWGYKLWTGTTKQGYVEWFEPYQGANSQLPDDYKFLGLGASVVLQFTDVLQSKEKNMPFHIFFDNFFSSMPLFERLSSRGLKGTGTLRENRISNCPLQHSKAMKKGTRGSCDFRLAEEENIIICKWHDNNIVTIGSNAISPLPTHPVKRFSQKEKKYIYVEQPLIIKKYNENMGGVDRADQNISLYRVSIRGKKWYFPLFSHCLDMCVQNAWQLHKYSGGKMDQLLFRRTISQGLLETYKKTTKRGSSKKSKHIHSESRFDRLDHLVVYQDRQTRCGVCHKQAAFRCQKCDVALHPKICFESYHTKE